MTTTTPPEVAIFEALLQRMLAYKGDSRPTIFMLAEELSAVSPVRVEDAITVLFKLLETVDKLIDEIGEKPVTRRSANRLKVRISGLFTPELLASHYHDFQNTMRSSIEATADLVPILDQLQFDSASFIGKRDDMSAQLDKIAEKVASGTDLSDAQQRIIIAQVDLIRRSLERFETTGVVAFRDSLSLSIGRLTIELGHGNDKQNRAVREVIDDLLRVKDVAESAGGMLALTGPYVAGLLTGPALG